MQHQDWTPVIISGKNKLSASTKRKNMVVQKKQTYSQTASKNKKLDESNEAKKILKVPKEVARQIIDGRVAKDLKQKQLASMLSIPVKIISDIESCKSAYNKNFINKIGRKLGIKIEHK